MSTNAAPTTTSNGNKAAARLNKDGTPRKKAERIPRSEEEVAFSGCNNVLKRLPKEIRGNVMKALTALWGAS
jgi:hypothetical protein